MKLGHRHAGIGIIVIALAAQKYQERRLKGRISIMSFHDPSHQGQGTGSEHTGEYHSRKIQARPGDEARRLFPFSQTRPPGSPPKAIRFVQGVKSQKVKNSDGRYGSATATSMALSFSALCWRPCWRAGADCDE